MNIVHADSLTAMRQMDDGIVDFVLADPPYSTFPLINESITEARRVSSGASFYFMYAEDLFDLDQRPDQVLFWCKPISTKNTTRRFSRFVEVIACYDLNRTYLRQDTFWATRSGVYTDHVTHKTTHPFEKPVSLLEKLVASVTNKFDYVLDPFAGSGSVQQACNLLKRECLSIDIDKKW